MYLLISGDENIVDKISETPKATKRPIYADIFKPSPKVATPAANMSTPKHGQIKFNFRKSN